MKAARREADVNVSYNSAAVVRNSSEEFTVTVLIRGPPFLPLVEVGWLDKDEELLLGFVGGTGGVFVRLVGPVEGPVPAACCMSLPCSEMRAGPSCLSRLLSSGTIRERTRSLTGCLDEESE